MRSALPRRRRCRPPALSFGRSTASTARAKDLDETFGLIKTAEKAAEIYRKIAHLPLLNPITDDEMHRLEAHFGVKAREGYLS